MVGRTGPVSRGFRLRRPTRLREAASPCRDDKTSPCRMILNAALIPGLPPPPRLHTARPVSVFISPPQFLPDISARTTYHSPQSRIGIPRPRTAVWGENRDRRSGIRDQGSGIRDRHRQNPVQRRCDLPPTLDCGGHRRFCHGTSHNPAKSRRSRAMQAGDRNAENGERRTQLTRSRLFHPKINHHHSIFDQTVEIPW